MKVGQRVTALQNLSLRLHQGKVGTIVDLMGDSALVQHDFINGEPIVDLVPMSKLRLASYTEVKDTCASCIVYFSYQVGKRFAVKFPRELEGKGLHKEDIVTIENIQPSTQVELDGFMVAKENGQRFQVSYDFLQNACVPAGAKQVNLTKGMRVIVLKDAQNTQNRVLVGSVATVMDFLGDDENQIKVGYIDQNGQEATAVVESCSIRPATSNDLALLDPSEYMDPMFTLENRFVAQDNIQHVSALNEYVKPNDVVILTSIENISTNALKDAFKIRLADSLSIYVTAEELAKYFKPEQEVHMSNKIELPQVETKDGQAQARRISVNGPQTTFNPSQFPSAQTKQEASNVEIIQLTVRIDGIVFKVSNGRVIFNPFDVDFQDLHKYTAALNKLEAMLSKLV